MGGCVSGAFFLFPVRTVPHAPRMLKPLSLVIGLTVSYDLAMGVLARTSVQRGEQATFYSGLFTIVANPGENMIEGRGTLPCCPWRAKRRGICSNLKSSFYEQ